MSAKTEISWTDSTWSPIVGCTRKSAGCENCYSERFMARFSGIKGHKFEGLSKFAPDGPRWTGAMRLVEKDLDIPIRWKKPRKVFVCSISDLFHEKVPDVWIDKVFAVMALAHWQTYQVLTKRPERMLDYFQGDPYDRILRQADHWRHTAVMSRAEKRIGIHAVSDPNRIPWRNVWLGVSVEDQATADERIPLLLQIPAAVRWVSYEPALGPVDFRPWLWPKCRRCDGSMSIPVSGGGSPCPACLKHQGVERGIDWAVCGGESGPGARPFDLAWARSVRDQCRAAGVSYFLKQVGAYPVTSRCDAHEKWLPLGAKAAPLTDDEFGSRRLILKSRKGNDMAEWPAELFVRELP